MSDFADFFDAELASPSLTKEALDLGGLGKEFVEQTTHAGPMLAGMQVLPDVMGSIGATKGLKQLANEGTGAFVDEAGNAISAEDHAAMIKKKHKELTGDALGGIGSAVGNIASWMLPGGAEVGMLRALGTQMAVGMGSGLVGKTIGRAIG